MVTSIGNTILNVGITWISRGVAPGYINLAPLGLETSYLSYFGFSKNPICSLLEYKLMLFRSEHCSERSSITPWRFSQRLLFLLYYNERANFKKSFYLNEIHKIAGVMPHRMLIKCSQRS